MTSSNLSAYKSQRNAFFFGDLFDSLDISHKKHLPKLCI
nr:MAG TPA: hypothetical protein [Caudoviricetes sp.]